MSNEPAKIKTKLKIAARETNVSPGLMNASTRGRVTERGRECPGWYSLNVPSPIPAWSLASASGLHAEVIVAERSLRPCQK
jgi:hypothetical protein